MSASISEKKIVFVDLKMAIVDLLFSIKILFVVVIVFCLAFAFILLFLHTW